MLYGLRESQISWAGLLRSSNQNSFLRILTEASPRHSLVKGFETYQSGFSLSGLVMMSFSFLGAWWVFILASFFMNFQGVLLLGIGAIGFLNFLNFPRRKYFFGIFWGAGIFLIGGELALRHYPILQNLLGESQLAFLLVDSGLFAILMIGLAGVVGGLAFRIQYWSLILGLVLLASSTISFNCALALFAGEALGTLILFLGRSQTAQPEQKKMLRKWCLLSAVGIFLGFFLAWYLKEFMNWGSSYGMSSASARFTSYLICCVLVVLSQGLGQMIAGHFLAPRRP